MRHRRRSHVCRHGASRPCADPLCLDGDRAAGAVAQLCGADRTRAAASRRGRGAAFPARAVLDALSASRAGDTRHHHRQPGHHHRVVLADTAGHAARLAAWHADRSNIIGTIWPDLRAVRELADDGRHGAADGDIRPVRSPRRRLRGRGIDHHADDDGHSLPCHAGDLALADRGGAARCSRSSLPSTLRSLSPT